MNLTTEKALELLDEAKKVSTNIGWIPHCICVGDVAATIANALGLGEDKARAYGYVHDIGKAYGDIKNHAMTGYNYLMLCGFDVEDASVCLTHSYLNNDVACIAEPLQRDIPFRTEYIRNHEYTIYEKLICLCDLMCTDVIMTLEKRLIDVITRKGAHENTVYHIKEAQKLKAYFDELMQDKGHDSVYDLFPNIWY